MQIYAGLFSQCQAGQTAYCIFLISNQNYISFSTLCTIFWLKLYYVRSLEVIRLIKVLFCICVLDSYQMWYLCH